MEGTADRSWTDGDGWRLTLVEEFIRYHPARPLFVTPATATALLPQTELGNLNY